jgi:hypothetical protein
VKLILEKSFLVEKPGKICGRQVKALVLSILFFRRET